MQKINLKRSIVQITLDVKQLDLINYTNKINSPTSSKIFCWMALLVYKISFQAASIVGFSERRDTFQLVSVSDGMGEIIMNENYRLSLFFSSSYLCK